MSHQVIHRYGGDKDDEEGPEVRSGFNICILFCSFFFIYYFLFIYLSLQRPCGAVCVFFEVLLKTIDLYIWLNMIQKNDTTTREHCMTWLRSLVATLEGAPICMFPPSSYYLILFIIFSYYTNY